MPSYLSSTALLLGFSVTLAAENWPGFRGPSRQGLSSETGLPQKWSAAESVIWKTEIPGQSWSSPIIWADQVFVTTATDEGTTGRVLAIDRNSGRLLWNKEIFKQVTLRKEGRNSYATPTPVTDGELIYAVFGDGSFVALDFKGETTVIETGPEFKVLARNPLNEKVQASIAISGKRLFIRTEKNLHCIGESTGGR